MSGNKHIKDKMIKIFGKKCFIEELHLRKPEEIEEERKRYSSKGQRHIIDQLTYHHIVERCKGGKATLENGALLRYINHQWLHRLPKSQRDYINQLFQEYKKHVFSKTEVEFVEELDTGIVVRPLEVEFNGRVLNARKIEPYNRAKQKKETRKLREEYERYDSDT